MNIYKNLLLFLSTLFFGLSLGATFSKDPSHLTHQLLFLIIGWLILNNHKLYEFEEKINKFTKKETK